MNRFQTGMHNNLRLAVDALQGLSKKSKMDLETWIKEIISLKYQMETLADQKGYSLNCKRSIPICKGECCKWHYPRNLTHVDFLIAIFNMGEEQKALLSKKILGAKYDHCPMLLKTGCFLSFEQRPVLCTNAYPCFSDHSYWIEKEKKNILFKKEFDRILKIKFIFD